MIDLARAGLNYIMGGAVDDPIERMRSLQMRHLDPSWPLSDPAKHFKLGLPSITSSPLIPSGRGIEPALEDEDNDSRQNSRADSP